MKRGSDIIKSAFEKGGRRFNVGVLPSCTRALGHEGCGLMALIFSAAQNAGSMVALGPFDRDIGLGLWRSTHVRQVTAKAVRVDDGQACHPADLVARALRG